ncbi:DNA-binding response regulator MtrA [archaeon BMS3Abin16]|nr:DNA-binding response regulator MtrA [archaeon BMS3Abin16]HDY74096.1 response regulator [Euryarchaeota archaeon]
MTSKIMVIDDDSDMLEAMRFLLESEGFEVITACGGAEGLETLKSVRPDYIFLDIMMPVMNGWDVLREIKNDEGLMDIPVSMLTVKPLTKEMLSNDDIKGIVDYVTKPFTKEDVMETLNQILAA